MTNQPRSAPCDDRATLTLAVPLLLVMVGCATQTPRPAAALATKAPITSEEENQIGAQLKAELDQKQLQELDDQAVVNYVRGVAGKVIAMGKDDRNDVNWQVAVIDDSRVVNAFATPGGYLYVYSGLLAAADDEAQLAGILAHQVGHVVARHPARNLVAAYGLPAITALASGQNLSLLTALATSIGANGLVLAHSQTDESEADELGVRYASMAGYDPRGLVQFFHTLEAKQGTLNGVQVFLSEHPPSPDRLAHIEQYIASNNLAGSEHAKDGFADMKQRLLAHVPPTPSVDAAAQALSQTQPAPKAAPPPGIRPASTTAPAKAKLPARRTP